MMLLAQDHTAYNQWNKDLNIVLSPEFTLLGFCSGWYWAQLAVLSDVFPLAFFSLKTSADGGADVWLGVSEFEFQLSHLLTT